MIGKFAVLLLVAACAVQGKIIYPKDGLEKEIDSIQDVIKDLIEKIKQMIASISEKIPQIIKEIEDKIKEILGNLNLDEIIEKIKQGIEAVIGQAGEKVKACIDKEQDAITELAQAEQAGAMACTEAVASKVNDIKDRAEAAIAKAMELEQTIQAKVQKCVNDNGNNVIGLVKCLTEEIMPLVKEVIALEQDIEHLITDAQNVIPAAAQELQSCMSKLAEELQPKEQAIIDDIKKCLIS